MKMKIIKFSLVEMCSTNGVNRKAKYLDTKVTLKCNLLIKSHYLKYEAKNVVWHRSEKYTEQKYKRNTFVFAPIFHELNSKI